MNLIKKEADRGNQSPEKLSELYKTLMAKKHELVISEQYELYK